MPGQLESLSDAVSDTGGTIADLLRNPPRYRTPVLINPQFPSAPSAPTPTAAPTPPVVIPSQSAGPSQPFATASPPQPAVPSQPAGPSQPFDAAGIGQSSGSTQSGDFGLQSQNSSTQDPNLFQVGDQVFVLDNSSRTFSAEPIVRVETAFTASRLSPETLGVSAEELSVLKRDAFPLVQKLRRNEPLSEREMQFFKTLGLDKLSLLIGHDGSVDGSGVFNAKNGDVVRVILSFKDTSIVSDSPTMFSLKNNTVICQSMEKKILNSLEYKTEFFFIVMKKDSSLTMDQVLDALYQHLFRETTSNLMNETVYLESIQIQIVYQHKLDMH
uniref:Uncharacterized protein n=1 Tax=Pediastrum duplex TaxID=3105 RepID=A0A1W5RMJ4_PEDDU|nr:hypothetical protein [Pediastrum duplex]AQU64422.1 hypothetical protein [Pediastrum duplex]